MPVHKTALLSALMFLAASVYGQSLGDVARQQRQKPAQKSPAPRKVITDDDMPSHPDKTEESSAKTSSPSVSQERPAINSSSNGEQLKAAFSARKQQIKDFEQQLDRVRASVHYVEANGYTNAVQYNQNQLRKQQEADRMQKQLDDAKKDLQTTQDAARKAGFGSSVYDPQ
jgi:hypothetical protein